MNTRETIIINDRYGYFTYYYYLENNKYTFCNETEVLLNSMENIDIDENSLNDFLNYGYMIDHKTMIKNVKKINPASIIRMSSEGLLTERYWGWNAIKKNCDDTYEAAVIKTGELFIKAVEKIVNKHDSFNIPLSGGLDSRAIVAAIDYLGANHKINLAYTFGKKGCEDHLIAREVAKVAGVPYKLIEITPEFWWENIENNVIKSMGGINIIHTHAIASRKAGLDKVFLNGFIGDLVLGGSFLRPEIINMDSEEFASYLKTNMRGAEGLVSTDMLVNFIEVKEFYSEPKHYGSKDYFFLESSRVKNFTLVGTSVLGDRFNDAFPFVDNDLLDYVYSLPDEWRLNSKLYKDMLLKYFPRFYKNIRWQKTGMPINASDKQIILSKNIRKIVNKCKKISNNMFHTSFTINKSTFVDYNLWIKLDFIYKDIADMINQGIKDKILTQKSLEIIELQKNKDVYYAKDIGLLLTMIKFKEYIRKM